MLTVLSRHEKLVVCKVWAVYFCLAQSEHPHSLWSREKRRQLQWVSSDWHRLLCAAPWHVGMRAIFPFPPECSRPDWQGLNDSNCQLSQLFSQDPDAATMRNTPWNSAYRRNENFRWQGVGKRLQSEHLSITLQQQCSNCGTRESRRGQRHDSVQRYFKNVRLSFTVNMHTHRQTFALSRDFSNLSTSICACETRRL